MYFLFQMAVILMSFAFICGNKLLKRAKINRFGEWKDIADLHAFPGFISCNSLDSNNLLYFV